MTYPTDVKLPRIMNGKCMFPFSSAPSLLGHSWGSILQADTKTKGNSLAQGFPEPQLPCGVAGPSPGLQGWESRCFSK